MEKCSVCNKTVILKTCFGKEILCKNCDTLINASSWNKREFISMDDLLNHKNNAINLAKTNHFPENIIISIEAFFDEYIKDGYITSINGKAGQTLKVFEKFCIINTKNDTAKTSLINLFYQFDDDDDDDDDDVLTVEDKLQLAKGVLRGGLVKTGIGVAMSAGLKKSAKEQEAEKKERNRGKKLEKIIKVGDKKIQYKDYYSVETFSKANTANGYIKFIPNNINSNNIYECDYFFFNNSRPFESKKIKQNIENIKDIIEKRIETISEEIKNEPVEEIKTPIEKDSFEEIRKYKGLLDEGIITEEEFQKKKKELLNL